MKMDGATRKLGGVAALSMLLLVAACASKPEGPGSNLPTSGVYKVGKPYQVNGIWYYPKEDWSYDETGIASWYGPGFHQKQTANGEIYDQNEMTAAHKTLPMPSMVRVTNLDNGRSVVVRVNDRGPFVGGRIIDMTRKGAQLLGFDGVGTAKVRVQILPDETRAVIASARRNTPDTILAQEEGPQPQAKAAPRGDVEVAAIPAPGSASQASPPPPQPRQSSPKPMLGQTPEPIADPKTIPGSDVDGRFVPAPVVSTLPVGGPRRIYVQAGSFSVADNASRLKSRLSAIGNTTVSQATVEGRRFYRVRVGPIGDVSQADAILNRVVESGATDAKIVVD